MSNNTKKKTKIKKWSKYTLTKKQKFHKAKTSKLIYIDFSLMGLLKLKKKQYVIFIGHQCKIYTKQF